MSLTNWKRAAVNLSRACSPLTSEMTGMSVPQADSAVLRASGANVREASQSDIECSVSLRHFTDGDLTTGSPGSFSVSSCECSDRASRYNILIYFRPISCFAWFSRLLLYNWTNVRVESFSFPEQTEVFTTEKSQ